VGVVEVRKIQKNSGNSVSLRLRNSSERELKLFLEPWGEEYRMPPNLALNVVAHGPRGDCLEVEFALDRVTVYGWSGSTVALFDGEAELGDGSREREPVPPTPSRHE
jgi:hypothetical protein